VVPAQDAPHRAAWQAEYIGLLVKSVKSSCDKRIANAPYPGQVFGLHKALLAPLQLPRLLSKSPQCLRASSLVAALHDRFMSTMLEPLYPGGQRSPATIIVIDPQGGKKPLPAG
jgi:hypothetical protein